MDSIIIYGSQYGTTKMYAEELSKRINVKALSFEKIDDLNKYNKIIYLGGLYAGGVLGMSKTFKKLNDMNNRRIILVTVGLADPKNTENINNIRNAIKRQLSKNILEKIKIFHLRGGIDYSKLNFVHKTLMNLLYKKAKNLPEENSRR